MRVSMLVYFAICNTILLVPTWDLGSWAGRYNLRFWHAPLAVEDWQQLSPASLQERVRLSEVRTYLKHTSTCGPGNIVVNATVYVPFTSFVFQGLFQGEIVVLSYKASNFQADRCSGWPSLSTMHLLGTELKGQVNPSANFAHANSTYKAHKVHVDTKHR